ncbi:glycosyltransferase involved in cell wall biosynthesis [Marinoscillum furvescens DSM 4134]|uniref:Glycosyltransferase involved in cell wall biosynthesis n=2 Tax=Marinoscillum furvescens TaxID=1026 RepID=A0A3D9L6R0_MARFU|nr:glycosyltransferase involved in cell wall biosynthesis [Marinoscillum furvescens DSM 4134]
MLGWEYAPRISGGLGVACQEMAETLASNGHQVAFLLPTKSSAQVSKNIQLIDASSLTPDIDFWKQEKAYTKSIQEVELGSRLLPYIGYETFEIARTRQQVIKKLEPTEESELLEQLQLTGEYHGDLHAELLKYALLAVQVARKSQPDVIHAHDWVTFQAGVLIKELLGIPLCVHIHSTEYDRNGVHAQKQIESEEQTGMQAADHVFCVSRMVRNTLTTRYGIDASKISVIPNASSLILASEPPKRVPKTIAFAGRLTQQKSPSTFIDIARDLTSRGHDFQYLIMGDGHLRQNLEAHVSNSNFSQRVTFTGFLDRSKLLQQLGKVDLLIVPSTSEPFGLIILEALLKNVPVAAARGVGIAEFIPSLPQVERWDHYSYVRLAERLMTDPDYRKSTLAYCQKEASRLSWQTSIQQMEKVFEQLNT